MFSYLRGSVISLALIGMLAAYSALDRSLSWKPAKATVSYIDRSCQIIETVEGKDLPKSSTSYRGSCNAVDEWEKVRSDRSKVVDGVAVIHLSYNAPQTGQPQMGELRFDGRDDEFYRLRAGDQVDILVSNSDPTKIRKD
jgi:hypothetical protein